MDPNIVATRTGTSTVRGSFSMNTLSRLCFPLIVWNENPWVTRNVKQITSTVIDNLMMMATIRTSPVMGIRHHTEPVMTAEESFQRF